MQPGMGSIVIQYAPVNYELLAHGDYELLTAMLEDYHHNDFRYVTGTANSVFPAGALLGFPVAGATGQKPLDAGGVAVLTSTLYLYTWTSQAIINRGRDSAHTIPLSPNSHVAVLTKDVDLNEEAAMTGDLDYVITVFWRGTFKPTGIIQDHDSYLLAPWPVTTDGVANRISIVPGNR